MLRLKRGVREKLFHSLLGLLALTSVALQANPPQPWSSIEDFGIGQSSDVAAYTKTLLTRLYSSFPPGTAPVLLLLHPKGTPWSRLHQELASSLARYGVQVEGIEVDVPNMDNAQLGALEELSGASGFHHALSVEERASRLERLQSRIAGFFGLQQLTTFFHHLREHRAEQASIRREFKLTYRGPEEEYDKNLKEALQRGEHYAQFRGVTIPSGFGGGPLSQLQYVTIAR